MSLRSMNRVVGVLAVGALLAGCGGNEACPVPEAMLDTARSTANLAERTADDAVSRTQGLESQISDKQARIRELEQRKQQLEGELAEFTG